MPERRENSHNILSSSSFRRQLDFLTRKEFGEAIELSEVKKAPESSTSESKIGEEKEEQEETVKEEGKEKINWSNRTTIVIIEEDERQDEPRNGTNESTKNAERSFGLSFLSSFDSKESTTSVDNSNSRSSSSERLSVNWENPKKEEEDDYENPRGSSLDDTSGIHSNEWSSGTPSDTQINFPCLSPKEEERTTSTPINVVTSLCISRVLGDNREPEAVQILLDEENLCDCISSHHDRLTRLAFAIETDGEEEEGEEAPRGEERCMQTTTAAAAAAAAAAAVAAAAVAAATTTVFRDPELLRLQRRVDKLKDENKDIFKDVLALKKDFELLLQYEEKKLHSLSTDITKLRDEIHEVHYMDDLLNRLEGKCERISNRNWPFLVGHGDEHHGELNLVV